MRTLSRLGRMAGALITVAALNACAPLMDPQGTQRTVDGVINRDMGDQAMAALSRGDYGGAERMALNALQYDPRDPKSLLVAGLAYQSMGRYDLARDYFEVIITNRLPGSIMSYAPDGSASAKPIVDVARLNMDSIDKITGRNRAYSAAESGRVPYAPGVGAPPLPSVEPVSMARPVVAADQLAPIVPGMPLASQANSEQNEDSVARRFRVLKRLLDANLITPEEYSRRRAANMGALLPFTMAAPAAGLTNPGPGDQDVGNRLREISGILESKAMTPEQYAAERAIILDALLPASPSRLAPPPIPPKDLLEAGQATSRTDRFRQAGLISDAEAKREKDAIESALGVQLGLPAFTPMGSGLSPVYSKAPRPAAPASAASPAASTSSTATWGVVLGSSKSEEGAAKVWAGIKAKFPEELGKYEAKYKKTTSDKGTRWRIVAGPTDGKAAAQKLCKTLKLHRQACDPTGY